MDIKRIIGGSLESNGYIVYAGKSKDRKPTDGHLTRSKGTSGKPADKEPSKKVPCFVIDPGYEAKKFEKTMDDLGVECVGILLTHNHYDHVGAVDKLALDAGAKVYMHASDAQNYGSKVDVLLYGGEKLSLSNLELEVIHTPGHSAGGVCFAEWNSKVIFTGDTIFNVDLGRSDLASGSELQLVTSMRDIIDMWPNDITIYPGHGDPATMKYVREHNFEFNSILKRGSR